MKQRMLYGLFVSSAVLLLLDSLTPLDINNSIVKLILLFFTVTLTVIFVGFSQKFKSKNFILFTIVIVGFLCFGKHFFTWCGDWKTQTIIYQNSHFANRTIEFQMQDKGAFGYNRRTIDRLKLIPFVDWIKEIDENNINTLTWEKVDIHVNELELKGG